MENPKNQHCRKIEYQKIGFDLSSFYLFRFRCKIKFDLSHFNVLGYLQVCEFDIQFFDVSPIPKFVRTLINIIIYFNLFIFTSAKIGNRSCLQSMDFVCRLERRFFHNRSKNNNNYIDQI